MADPETLSVLRSIDTTLKALLALSQQRKAAPSNGNGSSPSVASDRDLDDKYGDPEVKFHPRDWTGEPQKGKRMSECPPAFLEMIAETFDYFAAKAADTGELTTNGKPVADYKRKDAARARGWAKRLRSGWKPTKPKSDTGPSGWPTDDDAPNWP